jgi:peptidoglycan/xylan/chitin deacetylase (PgdA/CDA1 family)
LDHGSFIISLDFELLWGVRDIKTISDYGENIRGVHTVMPKLLEIFKEYDIKATFSTVGFLFFESKEELLKSLPERKPAYKDPNLSPYNGHFNQMGKNAQEDPYHFAPHLIRLIRQYPGHEIGTHTFSHYYCVEKGQTPEDFRADLQAAIKTAGDQGIHLTSIIFPRNQYSKDYLEICREMGIICYRGNASAWLYQPIEYEKESQFRRLVRITDAYLNLTGHNCYSPEELKGSLPLNIPSSRLLRPYIPRLKNLEGLRLKRITSGMSFAAKEKKLFHLWWHPHNFGIHQDENLNFLRKILSHFRELRSLYGFENQTMTGFAHELLGNN